MSAVQDEQTVPLRCSGGCGRDSNSCVLSSPVIWGDQLGHLCAICLSGYLQLRRNWESRTLHWPPVKDDLR
jgi:hypothetical protein